MSGAAAFAVAVFVSVLMIMVMIASEIRIGIQRAAQVRADRFVDVSGDASDHLDSRFGERLDGAAADTTTEQEVDALSLQQSCQSAVSAVAGGKFRFCGNQPFFDVVDGK